MPSLLFCKTFRCLWPCLSHSWAAESTWSHHCVDWHHMRVMVSLSLVVPLAAQPATCFCPTPPQLLGVCSKISPLSSIPRLHVNVSKAFHIHHAWEGTHDLGHSCYLPSCSEWPCHLEIEKAGNTDNSPTPLSPSSPTSSHSEACPFYIIHISWIHQLISFSTSTLSMPSLSLACMMLTDSHLISAHLLCASGQLSLLHQLPQPLRPYYKFAVAEVSVNNQIHVKNIIASIFNISGLNLDWSPANAINMGKPFSRGQASLSTTAPTLGRSHMNALRVTRPSITGHTSQRTSIFTLDRKPMSAVNVEVPS